MASLPVILVVVEDEALQAHVAGVIASTGHRVVRAGSVEGVLDMGWGDDLVAVVMDGRTRALPAVSVPVIVVVKDRLEELGSARRGLHVVRLADGAPALVRAVEQAAAAREQATRIAKGTDRIDRRTSAMDLHAYTSAKLRQFLGEPRATMVMAQMTAGLPDGMIVTTKDLHLAAQRLREMGELEATIASLLSGQAVLLDSDRTLRS